MSQELYPASTTGGLTDAELRATPVPVADGGASLTVDGTVTVQDGGGSLTIDDGGGSITVDGALTISSDTHDAAAGTGVLLTGAYASASAPAAVSADGDAVRLWASRTGVLQVGDGGAALSVDDGGASLTVDGTVNVGTDQHDELAEVRVTLLGGYASASAPTAVSGDGDAVRLWASRTGVLQVGDAGTTLSIDDGAGSITVDGTVAVSGTVAVTDGGSSLTVDDGGSSLTVDGTLDVRGPATSNSVAGSTYYFPIVGYGSSATPTAIGGDGRYVPLWADTVGRLHVQPPRSSTATTSQVSDAASSTQLLAANTSRIGATVYNDSAAILYVKCGTTASTTDYTAQLPPGGYWESPFGYTGRIDGLWEFDSNSGAARITEYT